ncbi:uncharacterized protein METZ01_LOCUS475830, partial [marine metagenome]
NPGTVTDKEPGKKDKAVSAAQGFTFKKREDGKWEMANKPGSGMDKTTEPDEADKADAKERGNEYVKDDDGNWSEQKPDGGRFGDDDKDLDDANAMPDDPDDSTPQKVEMEPEPDDASKEKAAQDNQKYVANKETGKWDLVDKEQEGEYEMETDKDGNKIIKQASDADKWSAANDGQSPKGWKRETQGDPKSKLVRSESLKKTIGRVVHESNELQAIMALDDVGIKAEINKKGQVVIKKKDKKKA